MFVHEFERLRPCPRVTVLSACHAGSHTSPAEREILGLSASLVAAGARSVVAATFAVPDSAGDGGDDAGDSRVTRIGRRRRGALQAARARISAVGWRLRLPRRRMGVKVPGGMSGVTIDRRVNCQTPTVAARSLTAA